MICQHENSMWQTLSIHFKTKELYDSSKHDNYIFTIYERYKHVRLLINDD